MILHSENTGVTTYGLPSGSQVRIKPGNNDLKPEQWAAIKDHEVVKGKIKKNEYKVLLADTEAKKTSEEIGGDGNLATLKSLNAEKAIEYVSGVPNVDTLKRYLADSRSTVVKSVQAQIQVLADMEDKEDEDKDN